MPTKLGTTNGPGYSDVADYLIELTREWGGAHTFTITADRDRRGVPNLFVVLKRKPWTGDVGGSHTTRVWSSWPCKANITFSGMLFRLCHEIDAKHHAAKLEREQQTFF